MCTVITLIRVLVSLCTWNVIWWPVASHGYLEELQDRSERSEDRGGSLRATMRLQEVRTPGGKRKRPTRREARGDAPSLPPLFSSTLSSSLLLLFFSFFLAALLLASSSSYPPCTSHSSYRPYRYFPFPFVRAGDSDILRESADVARSHPRLGS